MIMTSTFSSPPIRQEKNLFNVISWTALLTGVLDITSAIVKYYIEKGTGPTPIFKYIASGVFGKDAFSGGTLMIIWGIVFHFIIAFSFTVFLFLLYPKVSAWIKNKFIIAVIYGFFIWTIMNLVVLPLSLVPQPKSFDIAQAGIAALILICMIGLPVALIADRYYPKRSAS